MKKNIKILLKDKKKQLDQLYHWYWIVDPSEKDEILDQIHKLEEIIYFIETEHRKS